MSMAANLGRAGSFWSVFWAARNVREQAFLVAVALVALLALYYMLLIDPALNGRKQLIQDLPVMRQQAAQMQALAKQASALSGQPVAVVPDVSEDSITALLALSGLKAQSVTLTGDFVKIQLVNMPFASIMNWLAETQQSVRLTVDDAEITAPDPSGSVDASFTLRLPPPQ